MASCKLSSLGIANFGNLQLILNGTEVGAGALQGITLDSMALTLFDPANGALLASFYTIGPIDFPDVYAGVGNAGYGFQLNAASAAIANGFLASTPGLYIGVSANLSNATGGLETIFVRNVSTPLPPDEVIPEPATLALMGSALISIGLLRRRAARKQ